MAVNEVPHRVVIHGEKVSYDGGRHFPVINKERDRIQRHGGVSFVNRGKMVATMNDLLFLGIDKCWNLVVLGTLTPVALQ